MHVCAHVCIPPKNGYVGYVHDFAGLFSNLDGN